MKKISVAVCTLSLVIAACSSSNRKSDSSDVRHHGHDSTEQSSTTGVMSQEPTGNNQSASTDRISTGQSASTASSDSGNTQQQPFSRDLLISESVLNQLHHMNQKEIQLSQMAQEKGSSQQVKTLAQQVVTDHQAMDSQVQQIAKSQGIALQGFAPATYELATLERLRGLSGEQFDQAYGWLMHSGHSDALQDLKMFRRETSNPEIASLISQAMPKIQNHAKMSHKSMKQKKQMGGEASADLAQSGQEAGQSGESSGSEIEQQQPTSDDSLTEGTSNDSSY